ncbi:MAG TPA: YCF48-related protein [Ramlibacter sp.]|nr:YCF48-related protein [Ramlibacter sp.]
MSMQSLSRRAVLALGSAVALPSLAQPQAAAAVAGPLARPAMPTRLAARSALLGLGRAGVRLVAVGERGIVVLSDDAGRSWRQAAAVPVSATLTAVQFADARTGFAVGHYGVVLKSEDGGEHWTKLLDGNAAARLALESAQALAGGDAAAKAVQEAQRGVQEGPDKPWLAMHFTDAQHGIVVGAYNLALATEDGGKTWKTWSDRLPNPRANHLYAIAREGDEIWLAGEQGLVLRSSDAGRSFGNLATPYAGSFFTASLAQAGAGKPVAILAGLRGNAWRSEDKGASWQRIAVPAPVSLTAAAFDAKGTLYLANQAGHVFASGDAGRSLALMGEAPTPQVGGLLALDDGRVLAAGWRGVGAVTPSKKGAAS